MNHRLLILGSLREFVQLIEMARERGIYTIVCDGYADGEGKAAADKAYTVNPGEIEKIAEICRAEKVDAILTSFSDYLFECMVKIADKAGLPCYFRPEKLDYYRNKQKMKEMFQELGIASANHVCLKEDFTDQETSGLRFPVVSKPLDRYGSRGVYILNSPLEIRECFQKVKGYSQKPEILVEEYQDGFEFNMMTWVLEGRVYVLSLADREKTPVNQREIPISTRNVYPSCLMTEVYEDAREILQKVADYTGQKEGILSMQFFWNPGRGISVCEVAGRFLGYEHELIDYCSGLKVEELLLDYAYDKESLARLIKGHQPFFDDCCAVLYFHGKPGKKIADQKTARRLGELEQVEECWLFYREGEIIEEHGRNPYVARYYIRGKDRKDLDRLTEKIYREISITDEKGEEVIYRNEIPSYPK